jgi:hypothetical protein
MITIDQAREIVNNAVIPFPVDWKQTFLIDVETAIKNQAGKGKKMVSVAGKVFSNIDRTGLKEFYLNVEQLTEIIAVLRINGFHVEEDLRMRYDGRPFSIDIFW